MIESNLNNNLFKTYSPLSLKEYALVNGWEQFSVKSESLRNSFFFLRKNNHELLVPKDSSYADFTRRFDSALEIFGQVEQKGVLEIIQDLTYFSGDIIKLSLSGHSTQDGSILFDDGVNLFQGIKKLLLSTAIQIIEPKSFHKRLKNLNAETFLKSCRFGQTQKGSFVATIICPSEIKMSTIGNQKEERSNFTRAVTSKLINDVYSLSNAIDDGKSEELLKNNQTTNQISSNFCESLLQLQGTTGNLDLEIGIAWSPKIHTKPPLKSSVKFRKDQFPYLETIIEKISPEIGSMSDIFLVKIDSLNDEPSEGGGRVGEIAVTFQHEDEIIRAKVVIDNPQKYQQACDAHLKNSFVKIIGTLKRRARSASIEDLKDISFDV